MPPSHFSNVLLVGVVVLTAVWGAAADASEATVVELSPLGRQIAQLVAALDYNEDTGAGFAKLVTSWKGEDGVPLLESWRARLSKARDDHKAGALSAEQLADVESAVIDELAGTTAKELRHKRRTGAFTLDALLKRKTAQSVAYAQVVSVMGTVVGLGVEPIGVTYPIRGEQPTLSGHYACHVKLSDGRVVLVDPAYDPAVSEPFDVGIAYKKDDGFLVVADEASPQKLHRRIRLLDHDGLRAAACLGRAEAEYDLWHYRRVLEFADQAVALDPLSAAAHFTRSFGEAVLSRPEDAVADAEKALVLDPEHAGAWNATGLARWMQGDLARATECYSRAIEMDPDYASAYTNRAYILFAQGSSPKAELDMKRALEIAPEDPQVRRLRAACYERAGETGKIVEECAAAIEIDPEDAMAYAYRASALALLGKRKEAMADCARAIELEPDKGMVHVGVGVAVGRLGENDEAVEHFSKAIEVDPALPTAYCWRAYGLLRQGDSVLKRARAMRDLRKAIDLNPTCAEAYTIRGDFYGRHGRPRNALEDLNMAIKLAPVNHRAYACRAAVYEQQDEIQAAIVDLDKAIQCDAAYAWAYYKRGALRAELGEDEEAVTDLQKAVELDPGLADHARRVADDYLLDLDLGTRPRDVGLDKDGDASQGGEKD